MKNYSIREKNYTRAFQNECKTDYKYGQILREIYIARFCAKTIGKKMKRSYILCLCKLNSLLVGSHLRSWCYCKLQPPVPS